MVIGHTDMFLRMGAAAGLGALIGCERQWSGHSAGLRTHLIVSLASATFMLVSTQFVYFQTYSKDDLVNVDTSRIAASVVSGVGFLGAGALLKTGVGIQGLTTAASMWLVAAIGLAAGGGMYEVAGEATGVALFALVVLRRLRWRPPQPVTRRVALLLKDDGRARQLVVNRLAAAGVTVTDEEYELNVRRGRSRLAFELCQIEARELEGIIGILVGMPEVRRVKVQRPAS